MAESIRTRLKKMNPFSKRGLIYTLVGVIGLVAELVRHGTRQPFGLLVWALIIGIGLYYLFILAGRRS
ncbi:MAG TPA: hypothetical protein PLO28_00810 [bacterium]|nr:hypothetical protein [bacterium]